MLTKNEVLRIVKDYCQLENCEISIHDSLPSGEILYTFTESHEPLWYVFVHNPEILAVGGTRCIAIERTTGKVVSDGYIGE